MQVRVLSWALRGRSPPFVPVDPSRQLFDYIQLVVRRRSDPFAPSQTSLVDKIVGKTKFESFKFESRRRGAWRSKNGQRCEPVRPTAEQMTRLTGRTSRDGHPKDLVACVRCYRFPESIEGLQTADPLPAFCASELPAFFATCISSNASQYFFLCGELPKERRMACRRRSISASSITQAWRTQLQMRPSESSAFTQIISVSGPDMRRPVLSNASGFS